MSTPARRTKAQIAADLVAMRGKVGPDGNEYRHGDGSFKKGNPGGPGRPRGANLSREIRGQYEEKPTTIHYDMVALGLGIGVDEIPIFGTVTALHVWSYTLHGLRGSEQHAREMLDRIEPKISRAQVDIDNNLGRGGMGEAMATGEDEADRFYQRLEGEPSDD